MTLITTIFSKYQTLSSSPNHSLTTLRDLFHFMLELKSHLTNNKPHPTSTTTSSTTNPCPDTTMATTTCRWSPKRVDMAARVIVEALRRAEFRWVSRQQVRDAARAYIGDTGLLDYVLKSLGNRVVGKFLVRRSLNPVTKVLEYSLVDISCIEFDSMSMAAKATQRHNITRGQLLKDLFYLYKSILLSQQKPKQNAAVLTAIPVAARIILDNKLLIKEYYCCEDQHHYPPPTSDLEIQEEGSTRIYCTIQLKTNADDPNLVVEGDNKVLMKKKPPPPPPPPLECFILKDNKATMDDLKRDVEERFKETYLGLSNLIVNFSNNNNAKGSDRVLDAVGPGSYNKIVFVGIVVGGEDILYENGGENGDRVVDCRCGADGDDGERMICCDICDVWQHSRCVGIPNDEEIPNMFLCSRCEREIVLFPFLP